MRTLGLKWAKGWRKVAGNRMAARRVVRKSQMIAMNEVGKRVVLRKTCEREWCE